MSSKLGKIGAVVFALFLIGSLIALPISGAISVKEKKNDFLNKIFDINDPYLDPQPENMDEMAWLDTYYPREETMVLAIDHNDMGYNTDAGNSITRSSYFYSGEPTDAAPGRTRNGYLNPDAGDTDDYYRVAVQEGQKLQVSFSGPSGYNYEILNFQGEIETNGFTATQTNWYFIHVFTGSSGGEGQYNLDIVLTGQNDAGSGQDAGDTISDAMSISPGTYTGYMDSTDWEDWYSFNANSGQGIFVTVDQFHGKLGDFDINLYNPSGQMVHRAMYYGEDELEYPADVSGTWKIKIDMFPGWDTSKWPDDYFLYGSGPYELTLTIGGTAQSPPAPIPQPEVIPVAQTFKIINDPNSNEDEYDYLAAVPSAVYKESGSQFVSPIVYNNDDTVTSWFGTADDTTQYLLDDWNTYLSRHGFTAEEHIISGDPIQAAANIATTGWTTSDIAVLQLMGVSL